MPEEKNKKEQTQAASASRETQQQETPVQQAEGAKAQVNPEINAAAVSFHTGADENGVMQAVTYEAGKVYDVDPALLKIKNVQGKTLLVKAD